MSPHGTGLINIMFSIPHSTLIECFAPYHFSPWFVNTASLSSIHYIRVSSFSKNPNSNSNYRNAEIGYATGNINIENRIYRDDILNPPVISICNAVSDAIDYTNRWRFVYETTDKWSPIFYYYVCCQSPSLDTNINNKLRVKVYKYTNNSLTCRRSWAGRWPPFTSIPNSGLGLLPTTRLCKSACYPLLPDTICSESPVVSLLQEPC